MASPSLLGIPAELQSFIFRHLSPSTLASLALASASASTAVKEALYAKITVQWEPDTPPEPPRLDLILRSLLEDRSLSLYTTKLALKGDTFFRKREVPRMSTQSLPLDSAILFIRSLGLPQSESDTWLEELNMGSLDAQVALLVALLPKLRSLFLSQLFTVHNSALGTVLRHSLCRIPLRGEEVPFCHRLCQVTLVPRCGTKDYYHCNNTSDVLPFFYAPDIENLTLAIDNPSSFEWPGRTAPNPANLSRLKLYRIREQRLAPILMALPNLKSFDWQWFYEPGLDKDVSHDVIDLDVMAAALAEAAPTLTHLSIDATSNMNTNDIEHPTLFTRGSLSLLVTLDKVKELRVPWVFLMGFSPSDGKELLACVPGSVEKLIITEALNDSDTWNWDDGGRYDWYDRYEDDDNEDPTALTAAIVYALEGVDRSVHPHLRTLKMAWTPGSDERTPEQMEKLNQISTGQGLEVKWEYEIHSPYFRSRETE